MKSRFLALKMFIRQHPRKASLYALGGLLTLVVIAQLFYPTGRLVPFMTIDGQDVSAWRKSDAAWQLNTSYAAHPVYIYYGSQDKPHQQPLPKAIGLETDNTQRVDEISYPWWLRLVPSSLAWAHLVIDSGAPAYERDAKVLDEYISTKLGDSCSVQPVNAGLKIDKNEIKTVPSQPGGTCKLEDVKEVISSATPDISTKTRLQIAVDEIPAKIGDREAKLAAEKFKSHLSPGIPLKVNSQTVNLSRDQVYSWMEFTDDGENILAAFNAEKSSDYFNKSIAPQVQRQPGVTTISTTDFVVTSRQDGQPGASLSLGQTLESMANYANGVAETASVAVDEVPATVVYKRTYSPTDAGLSALITQYASDNDGKFGISLIELSGKRRRANTNGDQKFVTASTYKLYVAYSALKRVEDGRFKWSDQIASGRNLDTCLNDMISVSDNACAEALVKKIGYRSLTDEAVALGAKNTTFVDMESYRTTANDLAVFVAALESGQLLTDSSNTRLLSAMKANIYRQGIPAGTSGSVANKVGFLDDYLHDAGVVYSPSGNYAIAIMTQGSSWSKIAELTRKIEDLRSR